MKYLITGAAGYLGSHIAQELAHRGRKIRMLDTMRPRVVGHSVEFCKGSVLDTASLRHAMQDVGVVFHCAESLSTDPFIASRMNSLGTLMVLEAARKADVHKVVYASSAEVYGSNPSMPWKESAEPQPLTPFGVSKMQGEYYCRAFSSIHGLETIALRYTDIYGPGFGIGTYRPSISKAARDYLHISDAVQAAFIAARGKHLGESFNIGGQRKSGGKLIALLRKSGIAARISTQGTPTAVSIRRAKKSLGYQPMNTIQKGIRSR
jgi:UDP-glucose 4-epimerase